MKIELKSIHHSSSLSEETEAFTANLYINNILAGTASNRGHGGNTDYRAVNEKGRQLISEAEVYCKTLPPTVYPASKGMESLSVDMDLEGMIDDLLTKHLVQKELARFNRQLSKATEKGIMYGIPGESFTGMDYKVTLETIFKDPKWRDEFKETIVSSVLPKLLDGIKILNTNIPEDILKDAGLIESQYTKPQAQIKAELQQKPKKKPGKKM